MKVPSTTVWTAQLHHTHTREQAHRCANIGTTGRLHHAKDNTPMPTLAQGTTSTGGGTDFYTLVSTEGIHRLIMTCYQVEPGRIWACKENHTEDRPQRAFIGPQSDFIPLDVFKVLFCWRGYNRLKMPFSCVYPPAPYGQPGGNHLTTNGQPGRVLHTGRRSSGNIADTCIKNICTYMKLVLDRMKYSAYNPNCGGNIHTYTYTQQQEANSMSEIITQERGELQAAQALTEDMYARFVAYLDAKPKTVETYTRAIRQLFSYLSLNGITQPKREDILAFREELKARGHKPTTIQNYIMATRLFFQWLEQEKLYRNIADKIKGAKIDSAHKKDYLTSKQVKVILDKVDRSTLQGLRDYAMMVAMITGGMRTIEASAADIGDLGTFGDNSVLYLLGKGRDEKTEYIILDAKVERILRDYLKARGPAAPNEPLFPSMSNNNKGKRMSPRAVSGIVKKHLIDAGYNSDKLTAHSLRHTAVTLSLLAGKDIAEVQQFARHANIATTMIYNHALDKAKNSCSEAITRAIL